MILPRTAATKATRPGRNDKGLVTYDRQDAQGRLLLLQGQLDDQPDGLHHRPTFTNRLTNTITAKVYANCDSVELFLNGVSQGSVTSTNCIFTWPVDSFGRAPILFKPSESKAELMSLIR